MPKLTGSSQCYKYLVANLAEGSNPSKGRNPVKIRSVFEQQNFVQIPRAGSEPDPVGSADKPGTAAFKGKATFATPGVGTPSTGTITVDSNTFTFPAVTYLGPHTLTSGVDYAVGGSAAATATNLAAAIDNLPGFAATPAGADVDIEGPLGPQSITFRSEDLANFTLDPPSGLLASGDPVIGPPDIS